MHALSKLTAFLVATSGISLIAGCSMTFPLLASIPGDRVRKPGDHIAAGSRVRVELISGRSVVGEYLHWEGPGQSADPEHDARFVMAVRTDSTLRGVPVPGDTLRMHFREYGRPSLTGTFLGVANTPEIGLYVALESGGSTFCSSTDLEQVLKVDESPVAVTLLLNGIMSGRLPTMNAASAGRVTIVTSVGPVSLLGREVRRIVIPRDSSLRTPLIVGAAVDIALIAAGLAALSSWDCCSFGY